MADTHIETTAPVTGTVEARSASRAATMAEFAKLSDAAAVDGSSATTDAVTTAAADDVAETAPQDAAVETTEPAVEAKVEDKLDPETEKRIAAVQKAEKRAREELARSRAEAKAELDKRAADIEKREAALKSFETLKARAKYDPAGVLAELGLTDEDFEPAARDLYARSKTGGADPKNKDAALRMQREREAADRIAATQKELADLKAQLEQRDQATQYERAWQGFYGEVTKAAAAETTDAPLMRAAMEKNPGKTQQVIQNITTELFNETGDAPDPADVIAAFEKQQRAHLADLGIDVSTVITKPKAKAAATQTNGTATQAARTLAADMAGATQVSGKSKSRQEQREETRRLMESGKISAD